MPETNMTRTISLRIILPALLMALVASCAGAHPGKLDANGCHTCRTNCARYGLSAGEKHCQGASAPESGGGTLGYSESSSKPAAKKKQKPPAKPAAPAAATATYVVDGDTIGVIVGGKAERVRLIGIDTPESKANKRAEKQSQLGDTETILQMGKLAKEFTAGLLPVNTFVTLEFDVELRDIYGRLLAYVWKGGEMINETIICAGYAMPLTIPPNVKYRDRFGDCYALAREKGLGLWSAGDVKEPGAPAPAP